MDTLATMNDGSPPPLYHGSRRLLARLEPRSARGIGPAYDTLCAVYATHDRHYAIAFALPIVPDESGTLAWSLDYAEGIPRIVVERGVWDAMGVGYVNRVPALTFTQIDDLQWIAYEPVVPLGYEVIRAMDYRHRIAG